MNSRSEFASVYESINQSINYYFLFMRSMQSEYLHRNRHLIAATPLNHLFLPVRYATVHCPHSDVDRPSSSRSSPICHLTFPSTGAAPMSVHRQRECRTVASSPISLGSSFRRAVRSSYPTIPVSFFSVKNPPLTYFARPDLPELRLLRILDYNRSYRLQPFNPTRPGSL
jgi:hypothetical protein